MSKRHDFDKGLRHDNKLRMLAWDVEVVHVVGEVVPIAEGATAWADGEVKGETALRIVAAWMHPRLHHAFTYRVAIEELREMANRVIHEAPS
jgi:hypothetical protein